jgi:hypothetical protein
MRVKTAVDEGPISEGADLVGLHPDVRENRERFLPPASDAVMAAVRLAALDRNLIRRELDVRGGQGEKAS